jgi:hypothetical protein
MRIGVNEYSKLARPSNATPTTAGCACLDDKV